ncbi:hypothetical protein ACIQXW_23690 [Lysinibacillus sp. NPDC097162]|uniref:hypothetical protein n=1 Tax=Lysinibacillus sp. NPDC097162 TaxID=3364140 RepID=UPI0038248444
MKYRKKPVVVDAIKWDGQNLVECIQFMGQDVNLHDRMESEKFDDYRELVHRDGLKIYTLEGVMNANEGDYIIKGVQGEFYPCKPDIFQATYEIVD